MFKLEKAIIFALVFAVGMLGTSSVAVAGKGNGPGPHVTGSDVQYYYCHHRMTWISFNAHEAYNGRPLKGEVHYTDENGDWFDDDVTCVNVLEEESQAIFSGQVVSSNRDDWIGKWFVIGVYDGGSPGRDHDTVYVWAHFWDEDPGCDELPPLKYPVLSGNLVVHPGHQKIAVDYSMPSEFKAGPNPFNATTQISYFLPQAGAVQLDVFNIAGQRVETLIQGWQTAGEHRVTWDAEDFISGVYFLRLSAGSENSVRKVTLLK
jgi:hypothetical protein